jgi:hypothetical protein
MSRFPFAAAAMRCKDAATRDRFVQAVFFRCRMNPERVLRAF